MNYWLGFGTGIGWTILALYGWAIASANSSAPRVGIEEDES